MLYARLASGFRPGGANPNATTAALAHFDPDRTENYEVGAKGAFLENRLTFDVSVYHIDWKDIQLQLRNPVTHYTYFANGSRAKSEGAELSLQTRPLTGLTVTGWVAWDTAELTRDLPPTSTAHGVAGDRLPYSSRFSASLSVEQRFLLTDDLSTFISGVESYVGSREGVFTSSPERQVYPAYAKTDLGVGISYRSWTGNLFVTNAFDRRGMLAGGLGSLNPAAFYLIQPRTVGLSVARTF
jgi:outer membrane receptor protein involved in Fe transport